MELQLPGSRYWDGWTTLNRDSTLQSTTRLETCLRMTIRPGAAGRSCTVGVIDCPAEEKTVVAIVTLAAAERPKQEKRQNQKIVNLATARGRYFRAAA
jgi:hypothetical protein